MARDLGVTEALRAILPPEAIDALAVLTHLGDGVFLFALVALVWVFDRRRGAAALGILLGGFALYMAVKAGFALPRPEEELRVVVEDGFGFPSGHAAGSTVGYGLLVLLVQRGSRRTRIALATLAVVVISISRVAIGVHFLVDVVAGVALGLGYLVAATYLVDWDPWRSFALAGALAVVALAAGADDAPLVVATLLGVVVAHVSSERGVLPEYGRN